MLERYRARSLDKKQVEKRKRGGGSLEEGGNGERRTYEMQRNNEKKRYRHEQKCNAELEAKYDSDDSF